MRRRIVLLIAIPVALLVLVVGGTWGYFNVISDDAPPPLTFGNRDAEAGGARGRPADLASLSGTWRPTAESRLGYRVNENAFGQSNVAAGNTNAVSGELVLEGTQVRSASFTADMTKVSSDEERRDRQFQGRIMDTARFPTSTFVLTSPISFDTIPAEREEVSRQVTGDLTLRGTTRSVTFPLKARRVGNTIEVNGTIPITFAEWNIPNPSFGPVSTDDHGVLEFLMVFEKA